MNLGAHAVGGRFVGVRFFRRARCLPPRRNGRARLPTLGNRSGPSAVSRSEGNKEEHVRFKKWLDARPHPGLFSKEKVTGPARVWRSDGECVWRVGESGICRTYGAPVV